MIYLLQIIVIAIVLIAERYVTKWANLKIENKEPYRSGAFMLHELTGEKAVFMYKVNIIAVRTIILLAAISMIIIDVVK